MRRQKGVALILVLIILALVSIVATQLIAERNIHARRTANLLLYDNAWSYALGAEELARIGLVELFKNVDEVTLAQPWASDGIVYPIEGGQLSGELKDLRSCFNINAIAAGAGIDENEEQEQEEISGEEKPRPGEKIFAELLNDLQVETDVTPEGLAARLRDWIDQDQRPAGFEGREDYEYSGYTVPYRTADHPIVSITELYTISGFTPEIVSLLRPYLCVIPGVTELTLNVNTIDKEHPELLSSLYDNLDVATAQSILNARGITGFDEETYNQQLPAEAKLRPGARVDFTSPYFRLKARVSLGKARVSLQSLLEYQPNSKRVAVLARLGVND